ncbi:MAG: DEAD/DEAH box helicase [Gemmataceae bacterium]
MLREEQIDLRRQRARAGRFRIENVGKKRVFSTYRVTNPDSGNSYDVTVRGFEVGDNACSCPDFKANTLGTCKHIEAVLDSLRDDAPANVRTRKAAVTRPELLLHYGEQLTLVLHLPPRTSDALADVARRYFDAKGFWKGGDDYTAMVDAVRKVPEEVTVDTQAMEFIAVQDDRRELLATEKELLAALDAGRTPALLQDLLTVPLYDYQLRGAVFAACRGRAILGDDMGLGKTVQTLAAVELLARLRAIGKVLVVAPASVKYQWEAEIKRFTARPVQVIDGTIEERAAQYEQPTFYRLVNYEQATRDLPAVNAWGADLVVLDEAQRIKNWESKTSRAVKKLRSRYALVLTGTPIENKLEELYSIVQFVDDRRLGPAFQFLHDHRREDAKGNLVGYRHLDAIREKLAPIFLRRTRAEVLGQLPERTDSTVLVEMAPEQRGPYEEQRRALVRLVAKPFLSDLDRKRVLSCLTNMRMLCDSSYLFDKSTDVSPKLDEFAERVQELCTDPDHKAVVFSQWETMVQKAAEVLDRLGIEYALLHGRIPSKDRRPLMERFVNDPDCRVFLSTDAGGTGLNLQAADTVIHLEVPWNPAVLDQRTARVHRMGQKRPVGVIHLVTRGSVEERVVQVMVQKRALFEGLFESDSDEIDFLRWAGRRSWRRCASWPAARSRPRPTTRGRSCSPRRCRRWRRSPSWPAGTGWRCRRRSWTGRRRRSRPSAGRATRRRSAIEVPPSRRRRGICCRHLPTAGRTVKNGRHGRSWCRWRPGRRRLFWRDRATPPQNNVTWPESFGRCGISYFIITLYDKITDSDEFLSHSNHSCYNRCCDRLKAMRSTSIAVL